MGTPFGDVVRKVFHPPLDGAEVERLSTTLCGSADPAASPINKLGAHLADKQRREGHAETPADMQSLLNRLG